MQDFKNIFLLLINWLNTPFTIWGFTFSFSSVIITSLIATLVINALVRLFDK